MGSSYVYAACTIFFVAAAGSGAGTGGERGIPETTPIRSLFHNYNYPGIDWEALEDPKNDTILRVCAGRATGSDLAGLRIGDLEQRLARLEKGNLIERSNDGYSLRFPVVIGEKHARLQASIRATASEMVPAVKELVREIRTQLKGREELLYHFAWSGMMDGSIAWILLERQLQANLQKEAVDLTTCWWIHPNHPCRSGTNGYMRPSGFLSISWHQSSPPPDDVFRSLCAAEDGFLIASVRGEPVPADQVTDKLRSYGFADASGRSTLFLLDPSSSLVPVLSHCSARFARLAAARMDIKGIARDLDATPEQATVIAYPSSPTNSSAFWQRRAT